VRARKTLAEYDLPGGFEHLAYADGRFLLVREEREEKKQTVHSVAYEWRPGKPPKKLNIIRPSAAGDEALYLESMLTPDGRYYCWSGPRRPSDRRRIEVIEVATGKVVARVPRPTQQAQSEPTFYLADGGRYLWAGCLKPGDAYQRYDLAGTGPPEPVSSAPVAVSPASDWLVVAQDPDPQRGVPCLQLRPWGKEQPWLKFVNQDLGSFGNWLSFSAFSASGRYLAWGTSGGTVTVVDLERLRKEVAAFEKAVAGY